MTTTTDGVQKNMIRVLAQCWDGSEQRPPNHVQIQGYALESCPGLGVHRKILDGSDPANLVVVPKGAWVITHLQSGKTLGSAWPSAATAMAMMELVGPMARWTDGETALRAAGVLVRVKVFLEEQRMLINLHKE